MSKKSHCSSEASMVDIPSRHGVWHEVLVRQHPQQTTSQHNASWLTPHALAECLGNSRCEQPAMHKSFWYSPPLEFYE